ncbi:MAG: hypothetical protein LBF37_03465 [Rickettsiales bacterium]|jgi:hypothetical protein|nr:hypothetical protein [Rickettsiales bacterium]
MKKYLIILSFLLSGCLGYSNTTRDTTNLESAPYELEIAQYTKLNSYSQDDIKKIKGNPTATYSKEGKDYIEYTVPRADRRLWLGVFLIIPIPIFKTTPETDTIKYVFHDNRLIDIEYDYYQTHSNLIPLLPFENFGLLKDPDPTVLLSDRSPVFHSTGFLDKYDYTDAFFNKKAACGNALTSSGGGNIKLQDIHFTLPTDVVYEPLPQIPKTGFYKRTNYKCDGSVCIDLLCTNGNCVDSAPKLPNNHYLDYECDDEESCVEVMCSSDTECRTLDFKEIPLKQKVIGLECGFNSVLGIAGVIYSHGTPYDPRYKIQIIRNSIKNFDKSAVLEYINPVQDSKDIAVIADEKYIKKINGLDMNIFKTTTKSCHDERSGCQIITKHKAVFFDDNDIYYVEQKIYGESSESDTDEFNKFISTMKLDK